MRRSNALAIVAVASLLLCGRGRSRAAAGDSSPPPKASTSALSTDHSAWSPLLPPPSLAGLVQGVEDPEQMEGRLDANMARTVEDPGHLLSWTLTAVLQLRLGRARGALRTVERARRQSKWKRAEAAQLDFLEAAAQLALEPAEGDPLVGEDRLRKAEEALRMIRGLPSMKLSALYGHAWIETAWGRPGAAAALLDSIPSLPGASGLRLWKAMVRASSSGMDTWRSHFEKARAGQNLQKMREAAHLAPGPYLLTLQQSMDEPIETGLERTGEGSGVDFSEVESLLKAIPWDPPDFYTGMRRRMKAVHVLDAAASKRALQLMRDQHRFDGFFSNAQWDWKERCRRAVEFSEGKAAACEELGLWYLAGRWHWGRGFALGELGNLHEQLFEYEQAVRCDQSLGDPAYLTNCIYNLFVLYGVVGDRVRRLHLLPELVELSDRYGIATIHTHMAQKNAFEDLGDLDRAWKAAAEAYRESRGRGDRHLEITGLTNLAWLAMSRGENEAARRYSRTILQRANSDFMEGLPPSYRETIVAERVWAMISLGQSLPRGDSHRMQWYSRARNSVQGPMQYQQSLYAWLAQAEEELNTGAVDSARRSLAQAEELGRDQGLQYDLWRVDALQARRLAMERSWGEAAGRYEAALHRLETQSAELDAAQSRAEFLLPASKLFEEYIAVLSGPLADPAGAYAVDERDRARALLQHLGSHASIAKAKVAKGRPHFSTAGQVQGTLNEGELLLQYRVDPDRIGVWSLTDSSLHYRAIPVDRAQLSGQVGAWLQSIENGVNSPLASELAALLFDPVRGELDAARQVVIVADAPLSSVPFSLLRPEGHFLLEDHVVSREISGSIRVLLDSRPRLKEGARVLAVGYDGTVAPPRLRIQVLPGAEEEAAAIAALSTGGIALRGNEATATAVSAHLKGMGILHIASHSGLDEFGEPFLLLAPSGSKPSLIRGEDLAEWPLEGVSLVTLAGCESSQVGSSKIEGDLSTLGAAIFSGGSRDLIASLWKVEDRSTLELMRSFYGDFLQSRVSAAQSLRRAQLKMAFDGHSLQREWGAFQIYGP